MTAEQLQAVRAERWRQKSNPLLTLDDASAWVNSSGLCLFLPRRNQFLTPAPSFVEATSGTPSETPGQSAIANARGLMIRLVEDRSALPLNLFGALSEQPDFLASREAFPYIFSLRGGRNWKTPPPKATPLVTAIWKLLENGASLEATEIQAGLGHEITESAVLRSLMDLWGGLRVMPLYSEDGPTRWQLTQTRFEEALNTANRTAQTTALSVLVSLYLESVVAAAPDEIETFLSPLTARSKVREVVNGLAATRQLSIVPVGSQTMYYVAGTLPEFEEPVPEAPAEREPAVPRERFRPAREEYGSERRPAFGRDRFAERPRTERPKREGFAASRGQGPQRRKPFGAGRGDRPPFRKFEEGNERTKYPRRDERAGGERKSFGKRPYAQRPFDKPARPNEVAGAEGRPDFRRGGGKFSPKKFDAEGKFPPKKFGKPKFGSGKFGSGKPRQYGAGERRPFFRNKAREPGGKIEDRSGSREGAGRPFRPRREGSFDRPGKTRPYGAGEKRPFFRNKTSEPGGKLEDRSRSREESGPPQRDWKQKRSGFAKPGKPAFGKPKFGAGRPGGSPSGSKFGGKKFGEAQSRGKFSGARPGFKPGPKPPFRKKKDKGDKGNKSSE